jgi:hypothetical protein
MRDNAVRIISVRRSRVDEQQNEDLSEYLDWSKARRPNLEAKRVNVDFPLWVVNGLDREAQRLGVTRQS